MSCSVSIIIPTLNAELYIESLIKSILSDEMYIDEVVVIDSMSNDNTENICKTLNCKFISVSRNSFDHGGTRSIARTLCDSDILVYLTQDALPLGSFAIEKLVSVFKDERIGAAYGRQIPYEDTNLFGKHLRQFNYGNESYIRRIDDKGEHGIKTAFLSNSFAAYRKSAMDKIGWFKDGLILGEDTYAGAKLLQEGYKLSYVADAQVYHSHNYTVQEEFKRYFDIGVFHKMEGWILDEFGKPEGEGLRYIKSELLYLLKHKAYYLFPEFLIRNALKYVGYKLGRYYLILPKSVVRAFSMHHRWWIKYYGKG
jgi:rhamnosyltransferase